MAAAGIVLVDTMIVIEAVDTRCWNAITGQKRVVTVQECEDELRRGDPLTPGYVTVTDDDIARCQIVVLSDARRAEFQLSYSDAHRLDPGERDLLALASSLHGDFKLCCCDKAAVVAAHALGLLDHVFRSKQWRVPWVSGHAGLSNGSTLSRCWALGGLLCYLGAACDVTNWEDTPK